MRRSSRLLERSPAAAVSILAGVLTALSIPGVALAQGGPRLVLNAAPPTQDDPPYYIADEFIVVLTREARTQIALARDADGKPTSNLPSLQARMSAARVIEFDRQFPEAKPYPVDHKFPDLTGHYVVRIEEGADLKAAMDAFRSDPNVDHVEIIGVHPIDNVPNDSFWLGALWNMKGNFGINGPPAWKIENGDPSVIIGVLDTGVRYFHKDLGGNTAPWTPAAPANLGNIFINPNEIPGNGIDDDGNGRVDDVVGYDFLASSTTAGCTCTDLDCGTVDNDPDDYNGHGTHVAGIAAAITNNARGVVGVAGGFGNGTTASLGNGSRVIPLRVGWQANCTGIGTTGLISMAAAAQAMSYVATMVDQGHNITAINCSWGSTNTGGIAAALSAVLARDVMVVKAAGNGNSSTADFLGSQPAVVAVAGTQQNGTGYSLSNFGPWVDIAAPAVNITSTVRNPSDSNPNNDYYAAFDGTSMAAPHVCGVAALLESCRPDLTSQQKIEVMQQTSIAYNDARNLGSGIVNAYNAVREVCLETPKFRQQLSGTGEDIASNLDTSDLSPNVVRADDFVSDGRPITSIRWWGSELSATPTYRVDDGGAENAIGVNAGGGNPPGNTFGWANRFTNTTGGPVTITTIQVAFGSPAGGGGVAVGNAVDAVIWIDAAATGNMANATPALRWSLPGGVHANNATFATHTVPGGGVVIPAGADFYVGCGDIQTQNDALVRFPASIDQTPPSAVRSWAFIPPNNVFSENLAGQTIGTIDSFGLPGNWLIRAGGDPVPAPDGWFISFHQPLATGGGSPAKPLGLYFCENGVVSVRSRDAVVCDNHPVLEYKTDLADCCLVHAEIDSRSGQTPATPAEFQEELCFAYGLDIQAVIGTVYTQGGGCTAASTGRSADGNFWGWHTTTIARGTSFGLQSSLTSQTTQSGSDWLQGPWSPTIPACSQPNMAFELFTSTLTPTAPDTDDDGVPDVCNVPPAVDPDPSGLAKSRFVSFVVSGAQTAAASSTALRVSFVSLHDVNPPYTGGPSTPFTQFNGQSQYVGPPVQYLESTSNPIPFYASKLQCAPHFQDWSTVGVLHVTGEAIVPSSEYAVRQLASTCAGNPESCTAVSSPLTIKTTRWGDVTALFNPPSSTVQPDFSDISSLVDKFKSVLGAPIKARAFLVGTNLRGDIDLTPDFGFTHIAGCVDAFKGLPYPYKPGKCSGNPSMTCIADADCGPNAPCILCP